MDVGPDGSLCRITSSYSNVACDVKIVPVSEEEQKSIGLDYKLVWIGEKESDCESESLISDEEPWTLESLDIELGISKPEKTEGKTKEVIAENLHRKDTGNKPFSERFRSSNKNRYRKSYVSPGARNSKFYNNGNKSYNRKTNNTDSNDINPWLEPPQILNPMENYSFVNYPIFPVIDSAMNTPVSSNIDPPKSNRVGILGNSPYDLHPPNFQTANANHFSNNTNSWNKEYSNNYQCPGQNVPMSVKPPYKKHHYQDNWKNGPKSHNRNRNESHEMRGRRGRRFNSYRP